MISTSKQSTFDMPHRLFTIKESCHPMMTSKETKLITVNCPFQKVTSKGNTLYNCNRVCVKVYPGSSGEAYCRSCKLEFSFEVDSQSNYKPKVVVQKA